MPNRIIKDTIRTSKSVNEMTDFQFRLWVYLITYVDDYGRGSADAEILKGFVFPRRKRVTEADISTALAGLAGMGCISLYDVDGESYFCFPKWSDHQRIQAKRPRFPEPPGNSEDSNANSRWVTVGHGDSPPESNPIQSNPNTNPNPNPNPNPKSTRARATTPDVTELPVEIQGAVTEWLTYKTERREGYKPQGLKQFFAVVNGNVAKYGAGAVADVIRQSMASGYQGVTWDRMRQQSPQKGGNVFLDMLRKEGPK